MSVTRIHQRFRLHVGDRGTIAILMWVAWPAVGAVVGWINYAGFKNPALSIMSLAYSMISIGALFASVWLLWLIKAVLSTHGSRKKLYSILAGLLVVPTASLVVGVTAMSFGNPTVLELPLGGALVAFGLLTGTSVLYHVVAACLFVNSIKTNLSS